MDETTVLNNIYVDSLILKVKDDLETLKEIYYSYNPSVEIKNLLKNLIDSMESILIKLTSIQITINDKGVSSYLGTDIFLYADVINEFHKLYEFLYFSGNQHTPSSILNLIEYLTNNINEKDIFVVIPTYQNTFRFIELSAHLRKLYRYSITNPESIFPANKKFTILMFPLAYKNINFSNILLAHELGHYIDLKRESGRKLSRNIQYDPDIIKTISKTNIKKLYHIEDPEKIKNWLLILGKTQTDITKYLNNWFTELLFALKILGPCYIISFIEFILSGTKPQQGYEKHPPPLLRLKLLMKEFKESGFEKKLIDSGNDILIKYVEKINYLYKPFSDQKPSVEFIRPEPIDPNCLGEKMLYSYQIIEGKFNDIQKEINIIVNELKINYDPEILVKETDHLIGNINQLIIPCEITIGVPANPISIINCGVIFKLLILNELYNKNSSKMKIDRNEFDFQISKLVKKGLELCLIQTMCLPYL
jgi:hypothetical protein